MDKIQIVDQTIRLAQQGLWGFMMRTDHIEPIAEVMDRVGYKAIGTVGGNGYVIQVRNLDEDPWERVRLLSRALKRTTLRGSYQIWGLADFEQTTPRDIIALWIKQCVANGIKSFWVCDYQTDMEKFAYFARIARAEGAEVCVALVYASSPLHNSEHWARKTKLIAEVKDCVDAIVIGDPGGVLTPEYTREFLTTVQKNCDGIPIEFQAQSSSGLASQTYVEAMKAGVTVMQTAVAPLANGTSMPSTESVIKNARRLGFTVDVDEDALAAESEHFRKIAEKEGFPIGVPMDYDLFYFEHQIPGGMMTNLTRQLREVKMEDRLGEILDEVVRVRKDFGYPPMATPYSQIVGAQAADNIISGERYKQVSDSTIKYVLGFYGDPVGPLDRNFVDRVMSAPRTREFLNWKPVSYLKSVEEIRKEVGPELSDDELLLKSLIPGRPLKRGEAKKQAGMPAPKPTAGGTTSIDVSREFNVEVDGEVFSVRISPAGNETAKIIEADRPESRGTKKPGPVAPGSVLCGMAGLVLSLEVKVGDRINEGDLVAMIEAMKMRRHIHSTHSGVVKEICSSEGEIVQPEDVLMVVA
jgi:pyruvate/oxaloacetate carboxyltransferase